MVLAGKEVVDQSFGANLDSPDLFQNFPWDHILRYFDRIENLSDNVIGDHFLGLSLIGNDDAVAKHVVADRLDIFRRHISATLNEGVGKFKTE